MSNISFNPHTGNQGIQPAQTSPDHRIQTENGVSGPHFNETAGEVSFSGDRYARVDAYSRNGRATDGAYGTHAGTLKNVWQNLRPSITDHEEYGQVIGEPKLSEKAADYLKSLKSRFGNLDFVVVGRDSVASAKANAASYGNASHMVVLIDEDKLERMATDENFRKKYETIISQAQTGGVKLNELAKQNGSIQKLGVSVGEDGTCKFMAACLKGSSDAARRVAARRAEKKAEAKDAEKKAHRKHDEEARLDKIKEKREVSEERLEKIREKLNRTVLSEDDFREYENNDDYEVITADSIEELIAALEARFPAGSADETALDEQTGEFADYRA